MVLRYYDKYARRTVYGIVEGPLQSDGSAPSQITGTSSYTTNKYSPLFDLGYSKTTYKKADGKSSMFYYMPGDLNMSGTVTSLMGQGYYAETGVLYYQRFTKEVTGYERGDFIETIIAEDGTYPSDGYAGTFWYVRGGEVATPNLQTPNGGEVWNAIHRMTWTSPDSRYRYQVELSLDNGSSWQRIATNVNAGFLDYDFTNVPETSLARIRVRGELNGTYTNWSSSQGVFAIQHNFPPAMTTNLKPNAVTVDRERVVRLSWQHNDNDGQSRADIQWRKQGATTWNQIESLGSLQYYDINSHTLPAGIIEWRLRTVDSNGLVGPYSNNVVFTSADRSEAPVIVRPDGVITVPRPIIEWTVSSQSTYQIVVENIFGETVWDTGEVTGTVNTRTVGVDLVNGATYNFKVRIKNNSELFSTFSEKSVAVNFTPPPKPVPTVESEGHLLVVSIINPEPSAGEPHVVGNDVYKRELGASEWKRVAVGIPLNESYEDYAVASGKYYQYKVRAVAETEAINESETVEGTVKFMGVYLHGVQDASETIRRYQFDGAGRSSNKEVEHAFRRFAGRSKQVVEFGESVDYNVSANILILRQDEDGANRLEEFVEARETVCYRDGRGRLLFGVITAAPLEDIDIGWSTKIDVTEIDYSEEV